MPLHVPKCLANDPDVRRMAEKVIISILNPIIIVIIIMMVIIIIIMGVMIVIVIMMAE